ncbi:MAG: DUF4956 domain-containing protein [SAR324 cluster bacterium]|nr:DUF4956 domain-containing protein [SAR324 cluster bacterium]
MITIILQKMEALNLYSLIIGLLGAVFLNLILRWFYIRFGKSHSNRVSLANNFVLLAISVTLIIFLIKSSIALSLGLVGALSIVRFRAAIKEPEELIFLFFSIAIGLGFGAEQGIVTTVAFAIALPIYYVKFQVLDRTTIEPTMILTYSSAINNGPDVQTKIANHLREHCLSVRLIRLNEKGNLLDMTYSISLLNFEHLLSLKKELREIDDQAAISFIDSYRPAL